MISHSVTNPRGHSKCQSCTDNDGVFESVECLECYNHPLLKNNHREIEQ